jgi:hypothetical protein
MSKVTGEGVFHVIKGVGNGQGIVVVCGSKGLAEHLVA